MSLFLLFPDDWFYTNFSSTLLNTFIYIYLYILVLLVASVANDNKKKFN